ncbi:hypothetical protein VII00023_20362 [Vibrio ichthyoenteri ATCC 700023]|uniref:Flagellar brake protein n=1 Tax=Vibrio ichthyoenteri ATCC 700023 TaxID=870968 RepID=F9RXK4_9VIBR|nr:PilZ domain-containing protein [Vibrio ichthyoenteri]EGU47784.1 hypothetical protein VII00023_20362 [Vibrio ichthyoenteri ATCC 700023]
MPQNNVEQLIPFLTAGLKLSVNLEFGPNDLHSFNADYIGCKLGQYMIIEFPKKSQEVLVMRQLNNVSVVIRAITHSKLGHIIAFKSSVLASISSPTGLLLIRMPQHFASKPIRNHERYPIDIPVQVVSNTVSYDATMVDFSITGCALYISGENSLSMESDLEINCEFSSFLPTNLAYSIVSIDKTLQGHKLGIKFDQAIELSSDFKHALLEKSFLATPL